MQKMNIAAAYLRVSTVHQDTDRQRAKIEEFAATNDFHIDTSFVDKVSGHSENRPEFQKLKEWIMLHPGATVLCAELDRSARDIVQYAELKKVCRTHNVALRFLNVPTTGNVELDNMLEAILAAVAEFETTLIRERLTSKRNSMLKKGIPIVGRVPYGFTYRKQSQGGAAILLNDEEAPVVKKIFTMYATGTCSLRHIAVKLTKDKVPTRNRARAWQRSTIRGILADTAYIGKIYYGKNKPIAPLSKRVVKRDKKDWILLPVEPIVEEETFTKVQELLKRNVHKNPMNTKYEYLLSGLLVCGKCEHYFSAYTLLATGARFYRCRSRDILDLEGNRTWCKVPSFRAEKLEAVIWECVKFFVLNPDRVKKDYETIEQSSKQTLQEFEKRAAKLTASLDLLDIKKTEFFTAFNTGAVSLEDWLAYKKVTEEQQEKYRTDLADITKETEKIKEAMGGSYELTLAKMKLAGLTTDDLDHLPFKRRQELTKRFIKRIIVKPEKHKYTVEFMLPFEKVNVNTAAHQVVHDTSSTCTTYNVPFIREIDVQYPYAFPL